MSRKHVGALALLALLFFTILASQTHPTTWARPAEGKAARTTEIEQQQQELLIERRDSGQSESIEEENDEPEVSYGLAEENQQNPPAEQQEERAKQETRRNAFNLLNPAIPAQNGGGAAQRRRHWARDQHKRDEQQNGRQRGEAADREEEGPLRNGEVVLPDLTTVDAVNITLQSNTCRGGLFKHKVRIPGCRPKTITNRFCHGSCSSFYIPRLRSKKLKATFQSCAACIPSETDLVQIRLDCPDREQGDLYRTVVRVKKCACRNIVLEGEASGGGEEAEPVENENDGPEESENAVATSENNGPRD